MQIMTYRELESKTAGEQNSGYLDLNSTRASGTI